MSNIISVYKIFMMQINQKCDALLADLPEFTIGSITCAGKEYEMKELVENLRKIKKDVENAMQDM